MRRLFALLGFLAVLLAGAWLGGESLLARELRQLAAQSPTVELGAAHALRDPRRIGVQLSDLRLATPMGRVELPQADLWLAPLHLTEARFSLPPQALLDPGNGALALGLADASARLKLGPLAGLKVTAAGLSSGPVTLEGATLAQGLQLDLTLGRLGNDAPPAAGAAYDIDLALRDAEPAGLAPLPLPGRLNLTARGRVWLDAAPGPATMAKDAAPLPVGLRIDNADLRLGDLRARIIGRVQPDAQGRAQGGIVIYTPDAFAFLQAAANAGLIQQRMVGLAGGLLRSIAAIPPPEDEHMHYPEPAGDELRLPLLLAGGKILFGPLPLGPAPLFPHR